MGFDTLNVRDRDHQAFREKPSGVVRAVWVENDDSSPVPVYIANPVASGTEVKSFFGAITNLASGIETLVTTYTVPAGKNAYLVKTQFSGTNIATWNIYINSILESVYRSYFSGPLSNEIQFACVSVEGLYLNPGDIVELRVIHERPSLGDFDGRIQVLETL